MKKLLVITATIFLFTGLAYAQSYKAITGDNEVTDKNMVQVEETANVEQKTVLTLSYINTQIAVIQAKITSLESDLADMQTLKALVDTEASKVVLKVEEIE